MNLNQVVGGTEEFLMCSTKREENDIMTGSLWLLGSGLQHTETSFVVVVCCCLPLWQGLCKHTGVGSRFFFLPSVQFSFIYTAPNTSVAQRAAQNKTRNSSGQQITAITVTGYYEHLSLV